MGITDRLGWASALVLPEETLTMLLSLSKKLIRHLELFRPGTRRGRGSPERLSRPRLEPFEDRLLPSTFTVTDLGDDGVGSGREGDLRYAIATANSNHDLSNRIVFQPGLTGTITLSHGLLEVSKALELAGPGAGLLTVSGGHASGVFRVTALAGRSVVLSDITIADGTGAGAFNGRPAGGGLFNDSAAVTLERVLVTGNRVGSPQGIGGGIFNYHGTLTVLSSTIVGNHADNLGQDGGLTNWDGSVTLTDSSIAGNTAYAEHGSTSNGGTMVVRDCLFSGNAGGLGSTGALTVTDCTFTDNTAFTGAGVENSGHATVTDCTFANNHADNSGGAIVNIVGDLTVSGSTMTGCTALYGGGILAFSGQLSLTNSTISGNVGQRQGGGIYYNDGLLDVSNSTIVFNTTTQPFPRSDWGGGGIYAEPGRVLVRNTIVAGNSTAQDGPDVRGPVLSLGYNLVSQTEFSSGWVGTDLTGSADAPLDPRLGPLQNNGGPTFTHALLADSPALHVGDPAAIHSRDQRGSIRGYWHRADVGAFETEEVARFLVLAPASVGAGEAFTLTLVALDNWGNIASTYTGTVHFSSTDLFAQLPDDTTFSGDDAGVHTFTVTLQTVGLQDIGVVDALTASKSGSVTLNVTADW
jgi:hypothetical protein